MLICCGLYDLLRGLLLLLPDLMLEEVMDKLIQPEALIVLVNHPSPLIQQGVMKVRPSQPLQPPQLHTELTNEVARERTNKMEKQRTGNAFIKIETKRRSVLLMSVPFRVEREGFA